MPNPCSAGHLVVRQLERSGVERVYCVPGESYLDVLDGLHDSPIDTVVCRHEGGAGFMAVAEGRLTGRPGVAMVTRGPGAANAAIAVHTAWQDATPMVLFAGLIPAGQRYRESFQEFDPNAWFGSTAKRVLVLDDPAAAAGIVAEAMQVAVTGRPGPVVVGLPETTLTELTDGVTLPPRAPARPAPSPADLDTIGGLLAGARAPVVVAGGEGWTEQAARDLADWAEAAALPVLTDFRAYDVIDHDSAGYAGSLGYGRSASAAAVLRDSDLQLWLGCPRGDVPTDSSTLGMGAASVYIGPDPAAHGHTGRLDATVVATPAAFVAAARDVLVRPDADPAPMRAAHEAHRAWSRPVPDGDRGVDLGAAFGILRRTMDLSETDPVVTFGAGNHALWPQRYLPAHRPGSLLAPRNGAMGFGIPAAVAAALVQPGRRVLSVAGDGCFLMNGQELAVAVDRRLPVLVLIVDNGCYATIRAHQETHYPGRPSGTGLSNPDFAELAKAYGAFGATVTHTSEFEVALRKALDTPGPAVLHLRTDPSTRGPVS
ncbi:thiamine pyrophosphate-dependent enzyme [Amycolatopsis albispora]|uniref:Acetolactate synthase n=1 Tax=Amycolatopsis albispora TaxID=1804986 RepID=A0A344L5I8_9PSEU|nr:thiamine pyrophosphate-dependent enzyme [Amycolatopsis albispora]AXB43312.1 acetolactate synthase [Amycolatopsis albispora]